MNMNEAITRIRELLNTDQPRVRAAIIGGLCAFIALMLGILVYALGDWGEAERQDLPPLHYFCLRCDRPFQVSHDDLARLEAQAMQETGGGLRALDCPLCRAEASAFAMFPCPNPKCGKRFVSQADRALFGGQDDQASDSIDEPSCPHCGTDIRKWRRENPRK